MIIASYTTHSPGTKCFISCGVNLEPIDPWQPCIVLRPATYTEWFHQFQSLGGLDFKQAARLATDSEALFYHVSTD